MRMIAVLAFTCLIASGQGANAEAVPLQGTEPDVEMFSPEWREQKLNDREANLRALDEEQKRFDRWERNAKAAVNGICSDCQGSIKSGITTVPSKVIPKIPSVYESNAQFDVGSSYYIIDPSIVEAQADID